MRKWKSTRIVHAKRKNANGMDTVMNAESITHNQNDKGRFIVSERKKD